MNYDNLSITTYLMGTKDGLPHMQEEFIGKNEFDIYNIYNSEEVDAEEWNTFRKIIEQCQDNKDDAVVICRNRGRFSNAYSKNFLFQSIITCANFNTHLLLGGCADFYNLVPVTSTLFWVDRFMKGEFFVIFRSAFKTLMDVRLENDNDIDTILSETLANKLLLCPMIYNTNEKSPAVSKIVLCKRVCNKYNLLDK